MLCHCAAVPDEPTIEVGEAKEGLELLNCRRCSHGLHQKLNDKGNRAGVEPIAQTDNKASRRGDKAEYLKRTATALTL